MSIFDPKSDNYFQLASHLPQGRFWEGAFDRETTFGKLILGLSVEFYRLQLLVKEADAELDIRRTNRLISDWEESVGIPNACFSVNASIAERRKQIEGLLSNYGGVQTAADFVRVAAFFGYTVRVVPGGETARFPLKFPAMITTQKIAAHFIWVFYQVTAVDDAAFVTEFPVPFGLGAKGFLECIFSVLAPANVKVKVINEV